MAAERSTASQRGSGGRRPPKRRAPTGRTGERSEPVRPFAFFDFDNTLIHGDAGPLFGKYLFWHRHAAIEARRHGLGRFWAKCRLWGRYAPFMVWMGINAGLYKLRFRRRSSLVRTAYKGLKGVPVDDFNAYVDGFVDFAIPGRVYPEMAQEVRKHQAAGRRCVIITTGMEPLVARCLRHLPPGVDLIGCRLLERNGRLTGHVVGPLFGVDKANILDAYCRASGVRPADCHAYSDHWSDKHMLEAVGRAVAVNPRGRLRRHAQAMSWRIVMPRLDAEA